jgi:glycosyltransferase involved in cell wall biosynthesis
VKVAFVLGTAVGGIGQHVRMLAAGIGGVVAGPPSTERQFGFGALPGVRFVPWTAPTLRRVLRDARPDVVHAHGMRAGTFAVLAVRSVRRRPGLVVTVHNAAPPGRVARAVYGAGGLIVARGADMVLTVSDDLASRMRSLGARRVEVTVVAAPRQAVPGDAVPGDAVPGDAVPGDAVPGDAVPGDAVPGDAVPGDAVPGPVAGDPASASAPGQPLVLAVGRLVPQKGFATLIEAAASWRDLGAHVMIAGSGPIEGALRARARALGVDVTFAGHRSDVPSLLAAADVFVLPSVWEGQSLAVQEALRAGVPVVASRVGAIGSVTGTDAALLVSPGDVPALAAAVRSVLTDGELAARLRAAALIRAASLPSESDAVAAALAAYDRLR